MTKQNNVTTLPMKRLITILSIVCLGLCAPAQAQNFFKKMKDKAVEAVKREVSSQARSKTNEAKRKVGEKVNELTGGKLGKLSGGASYVAPKEETSERGTEVHEIDGLIYQLNKKKRWAKLQEPGDLAWHEIEVLNIPAEVTYDGGNYKVVAINSNAFLGEPILRELTIPTTVTEIGDGAFHGCARLTSVTIPSSVKKVGATAFANCGLTSVTIENGVGEIGSSAFADTQIGQITLPKSVKKLGPYAVSICKKLKSVTIEAELAEIPNCAFQECTALTTVSLPSSLTKIGSMSFYECKALSAISFPQSLKLIEEDAFAGCKGLKTVSIPGGTEVQETAFGQCDGLTHVTISRRYNSLEQLSEIFPPSGNGPYKLFNPKNINDLSHFTFVD